MYYGAAFTFNITGNASDIEVVQDGRNFNAPEELKNVTFTIDVWASTLSISGLPNDMEVTPPVVKDVYLIGEPAGEWSPSVGIKMDNIDNVKYTWKGTLTENQHFGFATELNDDDNWDELNAHRYGPESDGEVLQESNPVYFPHEGAWRVETTGVYTLTLDTETLNLTAEMADPDKWGLTGDFNSWSDDVWMEQSETDPNVYSVTVEALVGEFKFRANADWAKNLGASTTSVIPEDGVYGMAYDGGNFSFAEEVKDVTLTINVASLELTVSGMDKSGIDEIAVKDEAPRYFNLQGIRVDNPEKGIFIRVANGKSEKVMLL